LRRRVFELRYPDRALDREPDAQLIDLFEVVANAPDAHAFLSAIADQVLPSLAAAYDRYLKVSDEVADGPSFRILKQGREDKQRHRSLLRSAVDSEERSSAGDNWVRAFTLDLRTLGGIPVEAPATAAPPSDPGTPHRIPDAPARDERYLNGLFYWPDNFDPNYPYGEGRRLQLRTAISHLNEVWAVETAGAILFDLGPHLGWDFITDAARWLYDESRHMTMGRTRLERWGFAPGDLPLGSFIYGSCAGKGPLYRLGMLAFFETKNIGKKAERAVSFGELGDRAGQRDMEFDWADEAIHAGYGRRWLKEAMAIEARPPGEWTDLVRECEELVAHHIDEASERDRTEIRQHAVKLLEKAERSLTPTNGGP
jgi:uncharacterized ferritin-like protein (DUF455 family)